MERRPAALLAPVFETKSHPTRSHLGPVRFAALTRKADVPVYALGGIANDNAARLVESNAAGIAAIGGFLDEC